MLRIIQTSDVGDPVVLRLEGQVRGQWVDALRHLSSEILQKTGARLVLDLAEVSFIDADGLKLLRDLASQHVRLTNGSLFVAQQLKAFEEKQ